MARITLSLTMILVWNLFLAFILAAAMIKKWALATRDGFISLVGSSIYRWVEQLELVRTARVVYRLLQLARVPRFGQRGLS